MDPNFQLFLGIVGSGVLSWFFARWYYLKQRRDDQQMPSEIADAVVDKLTSQGLVTPAQETEARKAALEAALQQAREQRLSRALRAGRGGGGPQT